ncbi:MAG: chromosome segregation protein SMC [Clostridia bacterium]|nr:chromosome segregation protein SMC [Clostridia bacterium]
MRLKKLVLYGFKSFASRTEIVFQGGITGIVGPNGAGKSNISDAVRWVLGEQNARTLRGSSMSDVIFNGTQKRKPLGYCEVTLVFDNEDKALAVDYAEVAVTRRVYRSGQSDYLLNGTSVRLKDVLELFRDTGIGREGYSIIGQGRIDEILSRKSEDRRQVFEEAAGIVTFRVRKEEADRKLQRTLENAARVDDLLEEISRQLTPLEEQSRTARRYLTLFAEMKEKDLRLFVIRSDRLQSKIGELDALMLNLRTVLEELEEQIAQQGAARDDCQDQLRTLEEQLRAQRDLLLRCTGDLHTLENQKTALQSHAEHLNEDLERLAREQQADEEQLRQLDSLQSSSAQDQQQKEAEEAQARAELDAATGREQAAVQARDAAESALAEHRERVIEAMNRASTLRSDRSRLIATQAQMTERLKDLSRQRESLSAQETTLAEAESACEEALRREQEAQAECAREHQEQTRALTQAEAQVIAARGETQRHTAQLERDRTRWKLLNEMKRDMEGYNQSVRHAIQHARERRMTGVRGVLAQLITVPREIETAVDMALGAAQQHIVTDSQETARQLIEFLRERRLGRATFLPLDAIRGKTLTASERRVLSMPGCVGVASELVQAPPELRPVVEQLLGRTVLADDLTHGIPIMNAGGHAFRLVTLQGDVMHPGGSMTGGSVQSRMTNLLGRERELQELTAQLQKGQETLTALQRREEEAAKQRSACQAAAEDALDELHQQEIAVARETEHLAAARTTLEEHRGRMDALREAEELLQAQIADLEEELNRLQQADSELPDDNALASDTGRLEQKVAEARQQAEAAQQETVTRTLALTDLQHTLAMMRLDTQRAARNREQLLAAGEARKQETVRLQAAEAEDQAAAQQLEEQISVQQLARRRAEEELRRLENEQTRQQASLSDLLRTVDQLHEQKTRDSDALHRHELARSKADTDLRALQDHIWNTYELTYAAAQELPEDPGFKEREADRRVKELAAEIRSLGPIHVQAVEEYAATRARFDELSSQQQDLKKAEADLRDLIQRLLKEMKSTFVASFTQLQGYFSETFTRLFGGGHAELSLLDPEDPLNCGIEINAQPPGKKLQLLSLLSGGERALTAIAILFAMLKHKPTPFCILDEIEAALDDANIGYYADYLQEYSATTQFIVVTHRKGTMERCNTLYGVSMEEQGVSRMVSVRLQDQVS